MLHYAIRAEELNRIFKLLRDVLHVRITLFDVNGSELDLLDIQEMSPFCRRARKDRLFDARCRACDACHISQAHRRRQIVTYRCHAGLTEGVVPLYDKSGVYLGAIVFGQLRSAKANCRYHDPALTRLFDRLPIIGTRQMQQIAALLQYLSQYIIENELIHPEDPDGMEVIRRYIDMDYASPLTLNRLARIVGKSASFVSHRFRRVYGEPPMQYLRNHRLARGMELIRKGQSIRQAAAQVGFRDEFHFSKAFKQRYGRSPSQFKRLRQR